MARRASVLAVIIVLAVAGTARAESLAGETTIASARPGVVSVRLDRALHFDEGSLPSARFAGKGEWRAIALIGARGSVVAAGTEDSSFVGTSADLGRGDYQLYVATDDGVPVTATLTLPGLEGRAELTPSATLPLHGAAPAAHASASNPDTTVIGAFARTEGGGMGVNHLAMGYGAPSAGRSQHCFYFDGRAAGAPDAFDVGCPGGYDDGFFSSGVGDPFAAVTSSPGDPSRSYWFMQGGAFGEGANVTAAGAAPTLTETSRWMDFGDDPQPLAPAGGAAPAPPAAPTPAAPAVEAPTLRCPAAALRLPRAFRSAAARTALAGRRGLQALAGRANQADARRIAAACGRRVLARTAVVRLRGHGLTELAYVTRTRRGWRVWWSDRRQLVPAATGRARS